jgi:uncharacterized protein with beta-barrel porin domain
VAVRWNVGRLSAVSVTALLIPQFLIAATAKADDVNINSNVTTGLDLNGFSGATVRIFSGISVSNSNVADTITATAQSWILTNQGQIGNTSGNDAIQFSAGGTINNESGATISAQTGNAIRFVTVAGAVVNRGSIQGLGGSDTVALNAGGSITNELGGSITASNTSNAASISGGTTRTVTNSGLISNTGSGNATGVLLQGAGATNTVTNNATGQIVGGFNGIYASSTAVVTVNNFGSITSTRGAAVQLDGGGTITNSGTIGSTNSNGIAIRNTATAEIINSGTISGAANAINFTGAGVAGTHTVRLQTGSVLGISGVGGNVIGGTGTDNLILEGIGTEGIAKFSNFETLSMQGTDWTLTDNGTFSNSTTVQAGTLRVSGQLTSPAVGVQSGGTLTGNGTVVGNVTNASGGNVRVDSGTLAFNGNYIHQMGAFFTVGVTPSTNGVLAVTGAGHTATINGGTVRVMAGVGSYAPSTQYTILTTTAGRSGMFSGATSNFAFLDPSLSYDANNAYLTLVRNSIDFASVGITPNHISAGGGLAALGMSNPVVSAALMLTPDQARAAFDSVSGEIHPSLHALMLDESALIRDAILGRQRQDIAQGPTGQQATGFADEDEAALAYARKARKAKGGPKWPIKAPPPIIAPVYGAWVQGYGNWTRLNSDSNAATLRSTNGGAIGGVDVTLNHNWRFGIATGGGRTDARVDARLSSGTIDTFHIAAYGGGQISDVMFRTGVAYAHHDISTTRTIAFPGFGDTAAASYNASTAQVFGEAAYRLHASWLTAEAFADLAHVRVRSDGFTETGGPAALAVAQTDTSATYTTLGVRAHAPIPALGPWLVTARGSLGWQHAYDNVTPVSLMSFAASPSPFAVAGVPIAADALLVEAGLDALVHHNTVIVLLYTGRIAADASAHAVKANVAVKF